MNAVTFAPVPAHDHRVEIPADLLRELDRRVDRDKTTRESILREALEGFLYKERREAEEEDARRRFLEDAHRRDVEGYTRFPQTPDEFDWSDVIKEEEEGKKGLGW